MYIAPAIALAMSDAAFPMKVYAVILVSAAFFTALGLMRVLFDSTIPKNRVKNILSAAVPFAFGIAAIIVRAMVIWISVFFSTEGRALIFNTEKVPVKTTRSTQGVQVMTIKKTKYHSDRVIELEWSTIVNVSRYRSRNIPAAGALVKAEDEGNEQIVIE